MDEESVQCPGGASDTTDGPAAAGLGERVGEGAVHGGTAPAGAAAGERASGRGDTAAEAPGSHAVECIDGSGPTPAAASDAGAPCMTEDLKCKRSGAAPAVAGAGPHAGECPDGPAAAGDLEAALGLMDDAKAALRAVRSGRLDEEELGGVVATAGRVKALMDALTLQSVTRMERMRAGSSREALVGGAKLSGWAAKRLAGTARQLEEMPNVRRLLDAGELTLQNVFALGTAAKQCGAAAVDGSQELLGHAATRDSGSFGVLSRKFAQKHDPSRGQSLLDRQRSDRRAHMFINAEGMGVVKCELDPVSYELLERAVAEHRDHLWRKDGGRDGTPEAVRDNKQRTADTFTELCTDRDALTHDPLAPGDGPRGRRRPPAGPIIVVAAGLIDGTDPGGSCEIVGVGPVPASVLDAVTPDHLIAGALFGGDGQPLWLGRAERLGNSSQHLAVAVRDRGCVLCGAPMHRCMLHHVREWEADRGPTDIENLAALCNDCHRRLHRMRRRLVRHVDQHRLITWTTEPRELPPDDDDDGHGPPDGTGGDGRGPGGPGSDGDGSARDRPSGGDGRDPPHNARGGGARGAGSGDDGSARNPPPSGDGRDPPDSAPKGGARGPGGTDRSGDRSARNPPPGAPRRTSRRGQGPTRSAGWGRAPPSGGG